ncbi:MAG: hypothetical protein J6Z22_01250 [Lachnospiraceae bacterium]|nr:hypothetical protein [Lachnospiraceae bacterium]
MNIQARVISLRELLASQANHWAIFPALILFVESSYLSGTVIFAWVFLGFLPVCTFIARELVESFLLQVLMFPIFVGVLVLLPIEPLNLKAAMIFVGIVYTILSLWKSAKQRNAATHAFPPFVPLMINLVLCIIAVYVSNARFTFLMHVSAIISIIMSLLTFYVDRFYIFTVSNEGTSSSMPRKKIFRSGFSSSVFYLGITSLVLLFIASFSVSDEFFRVVINFLQKSFGRMIRKFLDLFPHRDKVDMIKDGAEMEPFTMETLPDKETPFFMRILEVITFAFVVSVILLLIASLIYNLVKWLLGKKPVKKVEEAEEESEAIDLHESISSKAPRAYEEEGDDSLLSPAMKIRKLYRKRALASNFERERLFRMTAREFAADESLPEMPAIYEKARYSKETCTKEDLKEMQLACRRKKSES